MFTLVIGGCATSRAPDYYYNEISIRNNTNSKVEDVTIKVSNTHLLFRCSFIPPKSECANKFPKRRYMGNPIQVTWVYREQNHSSRLGELELPHGLQQERPFRGVLVVDDNGMIYPRIEQDR